MSDYEWWKTGRKALMTAAASGHVDTVTAVLDDGIDPNSSIAGGITALMLAASSGRLSIVQALLTMGANVNARSDDGRTALMYAATAGYADAVQALLDEASDLNAQKSNPVGCLVRRQQGRGQFASTSPRQCSKHLLSNQPQRQE